MVGSIERQTLFLLDQRPFRSCRIFDSLETMIHSSGRKDFCAPTMTGRSGTCPLVPLHHLAPAGVEHGRYQGHYGERRERFRSIPLHTPTLQHAQQLCIAPRNDDCCKTFLPAVNPRIFATFPDHLLAPPSVNNVSGCCVYAWSIATNPNHLLSLPPSRTICWHRTAVQ